MGKRQRVAFDRLRLSGLFIGLKPPNPLMLSLSKHTHSPCFSLQGHKL